MIENLPTLEALKAQARRLRASLQSDGNTVSHSRSLELVAGQYGFRDWNTLHAAIGARGKLDKAGSPVALGARQRGRELDLPQSATHVQVIDFTASWCG